MSDRFDQARVAVAAGDGVVARFPGILCVARPAGHPAVADLVEHCAKAAGANPGRSLARRLAGWLSGPDAPGDDLEFGTMSVAGERIALFLLGDVTARVDGGQEYSGAAAAAWSDQLLPFSDASVVLSSGAVPADVLSGISDLSSGVVPGAGVVFAPSGAQVFARPEPVAPSSAPVSSQPVSSQPVSSQPVSPPGGTPAAPVADPPAADVPAAPPRGATPPPARTQIAPPVPPVQDQEQVVEPRAPRRAEVVSGNEAPVERRDPLDPGAPIGTRPKAPAPPPPVQSPLPSGTAPASESGETAVASSAPPSNAPAQPDAAEQPSAEAEQPQTRGHLCSRGHLNDPRSHFCVLCGIRMNERTGVLVLGPRPPLGLLVFDNGATYTVDAEYLVGRTPETDERVRGGSLRPLTVEDNEGAVSRVHAEIRVRGWDVILVDSASRNGTFVVTPGEQNWTPIASGKSHRLAPGTRVRLGEKRTFVFESPSGVR